MKKSFFLIIIAGIMWGTYCIFVNLLKPYGFSSLHMTTVRLAVAFIGMLLYCVLFDRDAFKVKLGDLLLFFGCGCMICGTAAFYCESMMLTSASTSVVLMYISPVPIMIFSVIFFGERFNFKKGIAVAFMLVGCALVSGIIGDFKPNPIGIIMGLLSAAAYTAYNLINKVVAKRGIKSTSASLYTYMFGAVCAAAISKPWEIFGLMEQRPVFLTAVFIIQGLVTCLLPYFLYTVSLKNISVGVASALSIVEPLTGAILGFVVYKETMTLTSVLGIALVVGSVLLLGVSEMGGGRKGQGMGEDELQSPAASEQ